MARDFGQGSGEFNPGRTASDDHKLQRRSVPFLRTLSLRQFKGQQDAAADLQRVFDRLQARRQRLPFVVTEIGVGGARGDDQKVIVQYLLAW